MIVTKFNNATGMFECYDDGYQIRFPVGIGETEEEAKTNLFSISITKNPNSIVNFSPVA